MAIISGILGMTGSVLCGYLWMKERTDKGLLIIVSGMSLLMLFLAIMVII